MSLIVKRRFFFLCDFVVCLLECRETTLLSAPNVGEKVIIRYHPY